MAGSPHAQVTAQGLGAYTINHHISLGGMEIDLDVLPQFLILALLSILTLTLLQLCE